MQETFDFLKNQESYAELKIIELKLRVLDNKQNPTEYASFLSEIKFLLVFFFLESCMFQYDILYVLQEKGRVVLHEIVHFPL